ncbi:hypothetical protein BLNAU_4971 [Blattamonas nauphoetae]|uniref:Uncharacterized protein n=1 Tax=Blattamonas nauphoetae TaxID=2049346 RepID=A0ABQ9Y8J8_9EUKA|nr:hypothetical protein BLNAU_4971 [Blattamonas nauphoetae]
MVYSSGLVVLNAAVIDCHIVNRPLSKQFLLWTRKADEDSERTAASTLCVLHRMKMLDDEFKPIIATVAAEVANGEDNEKSDALQALTYLTGVPENHKALLDANILQTIDQLFSSKPSNNVICNVFAFLTSLARAGVPTTKQAILQILPMAALDTWRKKEDEGKAAGDEDLIAVGNNAHALLLEMQK